MIRAIAVLDAGARLQSFKATGHAAAGDRGYDIVCAAFSALARTAYRALSGLPGIELSGEASKPGTLGFEVIKPAANADRAAGIADFLVVGIGDLAREHPGAVEFILEHDWRE